jgi:hypothetical protein
MDLHCAFRRLELGESRRAGPEGDEEKQEERRRSPADFEIALEYFRQISALGGWSRGDNGSRKRSASRPPAP